MVSEHHFIDRRLLVGRVPLLPASLARDILEADTESAIANVFRTSPAVGLALYLASPSLHRAALEWLESGRLRNARTPLRLLAYLIRMSTRPTPLALCATVGHVPFGDCTTLALQPLERIQSRSRPDMEWLYAVIKALENERSIRARLRVFTNDMVLEKGDRLRIQHVDHLDGTQEPKASSIRNTPVVDYIRKVCADGIALELLVADVQERFDISRERSQRLIDALWEAGLFISELRPSLTAEPFRHVIDVCARIDAPCAAALQRIDDDLRRIDSASIVERHVLDYRDVANRQSRIASPSHSSLQVDAMRPFSGTLGDHVARDIEGLAHIYLRSAGIVTLEAYRQKFVEFYEGVDRAVPLLELCDPNIGIGIPADAAPAPPPPDALESRRRALGAILARALRENLVEYELGEDDDEAIFPPNDVKPGRYGSFDVGFQIFAESTTRIADGDYKIVPSNFVAAPEAAQSVGRFAALMGDEVVEEYKRVRAASKGGALTAELVFLPAQARGGNVTIRPAFGQYEIQVGFRNPASRLTALPLSDLLVGLSEERFYVYSKSLNAEIQISEGHVLNASLAPGPCRLLTLLQRANTPAVAGFNWAGLEFSPFLPRLRRGRIVFSLAQWQLEKNLLSGDSPDVWGRLQSWRAEWNVPRYVTLAARDNRLLLDLESRLSLEMLIDQASKDSRHALRLIEFYPGFDGLWCESKDGRHIVEFVASIIPTEPVLTSAPRARESSRTDRVRGPSSEWFYAKLYTGADYIDTFLRTVVAEYLKKITKDGLIEDWFFVRYKDPRAHVRLRIRLPQFEREAIRTSIVADINSWLDEGVLESVAIDTYHREVERYGGAAAMASVERLFTVSSELAMEVLRAKPSTVLQRAELALSTMQPILAELGGYGVPVSVNERAKGLPPEHWKIIRRLTAIYSDNAAKATPERIKNAAADLLRALQASDGEATIAEVTRSLFHMHCNRCGVRADMERAMLQWHNNIEYGIAQRSKSVVAAE